MVFNDIERFHENKRRKGEEKKHNLKGQLIECFFRVHSPEEIKRKVKASMNESYLPSFYCDYKLRSSPKNTSKDKYIDLVSENGKNYLLVDIDFHNVKEELNDSHILNSCKSYKKHKKMLGSDFYFEINGDTEVGNIKIKFCKISKSFLSRFFD